MNASNVEHDNPNLKYILMGQQMARLAELGSTDSEMQIFLTKGGDVTIEDIANLEARHTRYIREEDEVEPDRDEAEESSLMEIKPETARELVNECGWGASTVILCLPEGELATIRFEPDNENWLEYSNPDSLGGRWTVNRIDRDGLRDDVMRLAHAHTYELRDRWMFCYYRGHNTRNTVYCVKVWPYGFSNLQEFVGKVHLLCVPYFPETE